MTRKHFLLILVLLTGAMIVPGITSRNSYAQIAGHTDCNFCHDVHGAVGSGPGGFLLNAVTAEAVCLSCHGPGGISTLKADVHINDKGSKYPAFRITCVKTVTAADPDGASTPHGCHDSHPDSNNWLGGVNLELVGSDIPISTTVSRIRTPNSGLRYVVFESRGTDAGDPSLHSFADANEDGLNDTDGNAYDGTCEVCHTLTKHHRNDASGGHTHNTGKTCTRCHSHITNFNR